MDVNTGAIVAMATLGSYDPNEHLKIYDDVLNERLEQQYQQLLRPQKGTEEFEKGKNGIQSGCGCGAPEAVEKPLRLRRL